MSYIPLKPSNALSASTDYLQQKLNQASEKKLNYYTGSGQSLHVGETDVSNVRINSETLDGVKLFNGVPAIAPGFTQVLTEADVASVIPFVQTSRETHIYSMISRLRSKVGGTWLVANHARGAKKIEELTVGTDPYNNGLTMLAAANAAATSLGLDGCVAPFTTFLHGEANIADDLSRNGYQYEMNAYEASIGKALFTHFGGNVVPMFTTQIGSSGSINFAGNELDISNVHPSVFCAGPNWPLERMYNSTSSDYTHLNATGYTILGEMLAASIEQVVYRENVGYKPLQPKSVKVSGNTVAIEFHVPKGSLVVDTTTFVEAPLLGIGIYHSSGYSRSVGRWAVSGNTVTLSVDMLGLPIVAGAYLLGGNTLTDRGSTNGVNVPLINLRGSVVA
ncbi:hypothetical protein [Shewanella frigidimarina]|uniref:hypothetical protein n=1 Tax=Shewanella frigidimarina TaxID=56812 RepID=UPI003D79DD63